MPCAVALQCDSLEDKGKSTFQDGADLEGDASASIARGGSRSPKIRESGEFGYLNVAAA